MNDRRQLWLSSFSDIHAQYRYLHFVALLKLFTSQTPSPNFLWCVWQLWQQKIPTSLPPLMGGWMMDAHMGLRSEQSAHLEFAVSFLRAFNTAWHRRCSCLWALCSIVISFVDSNLKLSFLYFCARFKVGFFLNSQSTTVASYCSSSSIEKG